jgi:hypothetical protein
LEYEKTYSDNDNNHHNSLPSELVEAVTYMTCIRQATGSNLYQQAGHLGDFRYVRLVTQENYLLI